jgi:hypothetical protein
MPEKVMYQAVIAMALLKAHARKEPQSIEGISGLFINPSIEALTKDSCFALRRVPGGVYSEDVDGFISRWCAYNYAGEYRGSTGPVKLMVDGLRTCFAILCEEARDNLSGVEALAAALDFKIGDFFFCLCCLQSLLKKRVLS